MGCFTVLAFIVLILIVIIATASSGGPSAKIDGSVVNVSPLDGNTIRIYMRFTNTGKATGSATCVINTTVHNQFGDQVNIRVNSTGTNGGIKPGHSELLYQDVGVDNGDAGFIKVGDIQLTDC